MINKKTKTLYSAESLFDLIMQELKDEGRVPDILDYALPTSEEHEFRDYEFDVLGCVNYGGSEGIYIDLFYKGNIGDGRGFLSGEIGTIKTLNTDEESFHKMAVLMADFQMKATHFINHHLDDFTWTGYDAEFFRTGLNERVYGYTDKGSKTIDEAVRKAVKYLNPDYPSGYDEVVITENKSGKELRISKKSKQTQNVCPEMAANK